MVTHDTDMVRFQAPGVDTLVIIGNSTPTPTAATYATAFSPASECSGETANITYGDGECDGMQGKDVLVQPPKPLIIGPGTF